MSRLAKYGIHGDVAERCFRLGEIEGQSLGRLLGWREGKLEMVENLLEFFRFGKFPEAARVQVEHAWSVELDRVAEHLLTAGSLTEALRSLP